MRMSSGDAMGALPSKVEALAPRSSLKRPQTAIRIQIIRILVDFKLIFFVS